MKGVALSELYDILKKTIVGLFSLMLVAVFFCIEAANGGSAEYVGAAKCKVCHMKQYKSWSETTMATSFEILKPGVRAEKKKKAKLDPDNDYTSDPTCLKCHTTGYGKPGGFKSISETPDLAGVQCESCHGPGSEYIDIMKKNKQYKMAEIKAAGLVVPSEDEKGCVVCHKGCMVNYREHNPFNEKVDTKYKFNFKERLKKILRGDNPFKIDAKYKFNFKERLKKTHEHFPKEYEH